MIDDELPPDPDLDAIPEDLRILAGLDDAVVTLICEDGVSEDVLVLVPSMFRRQADDD